MTRIILDMEEVHDTSMDLLRALESDHVTEELGIASLALSFGRLASPIKPMAEEEEARFLKAVLEWTGMYFLEGRPN